MGPHAPDLNVKVRRIDGESRGTVCLSHEFEILNADGDKCLDVGEEGEATTEGDPETWNSWGTIFYFKPLDGSSIVMYEQPCGLFLSSDQIVGEGASGEDSYEHNMKLDMRTCSSSVASWSTCFTLEDAAESEPGKPPVKGCEQTVLGALVPSCSQQ